MSETAIRVVWHPAYEFDIGAHIFPTTKYRLVHERLLHEQTILASQVLPPTPAVDADVALAHTADYLHRIRNDAFGVEERFLLEVPFSPALREAMWLCAGGTATTARLACENGGIAVHIGGGFHHAFPDHGEGFCLINDVAIAARMLQRESPGLRIAIIDCDVHQGNGTAATFAGDDSVFTFSIHQQHNYPYLKPPSDLDVGLPDLTNDDEYLALLHQHVPDLLADHAPDLVFYLAGADPYQHDQLGGLALTLDGLQRRDALIFELCREARIPVAVTMAGGYAVNLDDTVEIHCATVRTAARHTPPLPLTMPPS